MVNIRKPPKFNFFNNYNTIVKETQEYENLFPKVEPINLSMYKQRTTTINYEIIEVAKHTQLDLKAIKNNQKDDNIQDIYDESKEQAMKFQALLESKSSHTNKNRKGVRFGISLSTTNDDDASNEFLDYHIDDNEDKERLFARRLLFTTLKGAKDSLAIIQPKFNILEPNEFKKLIHEPKPISAIDILVQLLANIYLPFQPPNSNLIYMKKQSDVIVTVRKSFEAQDIERILCHSEILNKSSNAFKEMFHLHVQDMEFQEKKDIHCETTIEEGLWRTSDHVIPFYLPCHIHFEESIHPIDVINKNLDMNAINQYCSKHEQSTDWNDPKNEDRQCKELERALDNELEENPLNEDYRRLIDEELSNDVKEFVRKQSVDKLLSNGDVEKNIDYKSTIEPLLVEKEDQEVNLVEELVNLSEDIKLTERHKFEANAILLTCKPFLFSLATSKIKETLDNQMLDDLQKFVLLADIYFVLTHLKVNDNHKKSIEFQDDVSHGKLSSISLKGKHLRESFRNSLNGTQNGGKEDKGLIGINNNSQRGTNNSFESLSRNSKNGSFEQISGSQIKRPSEVFAELKARKRESLLKRKKSVIKKILYPIEKTPLIEPKADLLDIEQQLDLCLPPPMVWKLSKQIQDQGIEEKFNEDNIAIEGEYENIEDNGLPSNDIKNGDEETPKIEVLHSEVDVEAKEVEEDEEEICKREHQHNSIQNIESKETRIYKIIKGDWTCEIFYPMLEYFYTDRCHILCKNVAALWKASTQILLQSLTNIIVLHPINEYCRLALKNEENRRSLLTLANASYKLEVESNMKNLKKFCELFKCEDTTKFLPYTFNLFTAYRVDRKIDVVKEGYHELPNFNVCILKIYDENERLFVQNANGCEHLTFEKRPQDQNQQCQHIREHWHGRKVDDLFFDNNRHKQWSITIFGPSIADECFKFYKYLVGQTFRINEPETFSLHMPLPFLKQPVLHKALAKVFTKDKLRIESNQGMTYYIGGETHGKSLTLTGSPLLIFEAMKCIPRDMVARMALRFQSPSKNTFLKVFSVTKTLGIDIEKDQIFLLKNYTKLKLALEYYIGFSDTAFIPLDVPREFTELVVPSKPF